MGIDGTGANGFFSVGSMVVAVGKTDTTTGSGTVTGASGSTTVVVVVVLRPGATVVEGAGGVPEITSATHSTPGKYSRADGRAGASSDCHTSSDLPSLQSVTASPA